MPQANSTTSSPRATSPAASEATLPCSAVISAASSPRCCLIQLAEREHHVGPLDQRGLRASRARRRGRGLPPPRRPRPPPAKSTVPLTCAGCRVVDVTAAGRRRPSTACRRSSASMLHPTRFAHLPHGRSSSPVCCRTGSGRQLTLCKHGVGSGSLDVSAVSVPGGGRRMLPTVAEVLALDPRAPRRARGCWPPPTGSTPGALGARDRAGPGRAPAARRRAGAVHRHRAAATTRRADPLRRRPGRRSGSARWPSSSAPGTPAACRPRWFGARRGTGCR